MAEIQFEDYSMKVKDALQSATIAFLHEAGGEIKSQTQRNTKKDTEQTAGSWKCEVDESALTATIGSNEMNAIYEEFGTGEYALHGDSRKTPWKYKDRKGQWHTTHGKRARRPFFNAFNANKEKIQRVFQEKLGALGK